MTRTNSLIAIPDRERSSAWRKRGAVLVVLATVLGIAVLAGWWWVAKGAGAPKVPVETLVAGPIERVLAVSGRTESDVHSEIRSSVTARVEEVRVAEGDTVAAGDELVVLDATQQHSRVRQALAVLDAAILREDSARAERDRAKRLGAAVSAVALANTERDLALAQAEVSRLQAALEQAQLALPDYRISAPISGRVLERSVDPGSLVTPSDILMRLADTEALYVEVQIDEIYADQIQEGQEVILQLTGRPETLKGSVSFVAEEVDELSGSLSAKLAFDTVPQAPIGLATVANILVDRVDDALTVPRSALFSRGPDASVLVLRAGRAVLTPITFVDWPADRVEVTSGLAENERVVVSPDGIEPGQTLAAQESPAESD